MLLRSQKGRDRMKTAIVGVYFGELPNYFHLWMQSCETNPSVDFKLVTDAVVENNPNNVEIIPMKLSEMKALAEHKIGMRICLDTPFKCCDYKPVYGLIFEDYLKGYDYWGHCDLDLIFGDLQHFFDLYQLEEYDKFLPLGHLALYRNTRECNERFRIVPKAGNAYEHSFVVPETTQFDELGGINAIYLEQGYPFFRERIFADISSQWFRVKLAENYIDSNDVNYHYQVFYWQNGKVFRSFIKDGRVGEEEFIYIHLKKRTFSEFSNAPGSAFFINADNFAHKSEGEKITKGLIQRNNPFRGVLYEWLEMKGLFRYLKRLKRR